MFPVSLNNPRPDVRNDWYRSTTVKHESSCVSRFDPSGKAITSAQLPAGAVPAFLAVDGLFDADWRIAVACRENKIHTIKANRAGNKAIVLGVWLGMPTPSAPISISIQLRMPLALILVCVVSIMTHVFHERVLSPTKEIEVIVLS